MENRKSPATLGQARERGVSLIFALLGLALMLALGIALTSVTRTEIWTTYNQRLTAQVRYTAEAGVQHALDWLMSTFTPPANLSVFDLTVQPVRYNGSAAVLSAMSGVTANYPDSAVQSSFNSTLNNIALAGMGVDARYSAFARLLRITSTSQVWEITSRGTIAGLRNAQSQLVSVYEITSGSSLFNHVVYATSNVCNAIRISGGGITDSFNSNNGSYAATHQNTGGNLGSNGNISISSSTVNGYFAVLNTTHGGCSNGTPGITLSGSGHSTEPDVQLSAPVTYPDPAAPSPTPPTTTLNIVEGQVLAPGTYGNINSSGGKTFHVQAGTYNINSLVISGGGQLILDSYPVVFNIAGAGVSKAMNLSGGTVVNGSGASGNCTFNYAGTAEIVLSGGTGAYFVCYAPHSDITVSGTGHVYGAIVGSTVEATGGSSLHLDKALGGSGSGGTKAHSLSLSWSRY